MRILVSNDDGYRSPGIATLARAAQQFGEVTVVAPERDRSGASNSLTLDRPLRVERDGNGFYFVNGTPTDCVHVALGSLMSEPPDLVVSGINRGANLGDDVIYSGTVAAAMEGRLLGVPAIAFSLLWGERDNLDTAEKIATEIIGRYAESGFSPSTLLNVNIPPCAPDAVEGIRVTRLGQRHKLAGVKTAQDPMGRDVFWIGPVGGPGDNGPETDFHAVKGRFVSITPIDVDLTNDAELEELDAWLGQDG